MQTAIAMDHAQQSLRLGSHEAELNRIDTAVVAAAKGVARLPSSSKILDALIDASVACADVVDNYEGRPIPTKVGTCLLRLYWPSPISKRHSKRTPRSRYEIDELPTVGRLGGLSSRRTSDVT